MNNKETDNNLAEYLSLRVFQYYAEYISKDKFEGKELETIAIDFYKNLIPKIKKDFLEIFKTFTIQNKN